MKIKHSTPIERLEKIKIGDIIESDCGKSGKVVGIEILEYPREKQFYFKLENKNGTILIIK